MRVEGSPSGIVNALDRDRDQCGVVRPTWWMGYHREASKVITYLRANATDPFEGLPAHQVAAGVGVPDKRLTALTTAARQIQVTRGMGYGRGRLLDKDFGVGARGNVSMLECPHKDCLAGVLGGRGGVLAPIATPETTSAHGRLGEELLRGGLPLLPRADELSIRDKRSAEVQPCLGDSGLCAPMSTYPEHTDRPRRASGHEASPALLGTAGPGCPFVPRVPAVARW